ncbi:hypothetical protein BBJ28_00007151 [Nothophytophthora sp. Chile5]|nr:hypothetical protein BBJ28_00007151 [Nothophytophthora sp. Chile5]
MSLASLPSLESPEPHATPSNEMASQFSSQDVKSDGHNGDIDVGSGTQRVRSPTLPKYTSSLDHDSIEGFMTVHRKKPKKQRFQLPKSARYVVANTKKHALEIYNNESRSELMYLLSLAEAVLSFESDNANIVMEKCFCVEVKTWKKKSTVHLQPQGFLFFVEDQARMLLWVKCIHLAIKRATTLDSELFRGSMTSSSAESTRRFSDSDGSCSSTGALVRDDRLCASSTVSPTAVAGSSPGSSPTASSAFAAARDKLTQRLVIDPAARIVTAGRTMLTPTRTSSASERQSTPLTRLSAMFSHEKQQQTRSPMSSGASDIVSSPKDTCPASTKAVEGARKRPSKAAREASSTVGALLSGDEAPAVRPLPSHAVGLTTKKSSRNDSSAATAAGRSAPHKVLRPPEQPVNHNPPSSGSASVSSQDSVLGSVNPLLDAQKPAFMSALSLVRIDLGIKTPHISGVKFVSANALTDEVTLDVEVRVVTDKSFVAELKMVSHLGAAACVSLRELFLVGTLRITLNPLATYWPCFSALGLSFTTYGPSSRSLKRSRH